MIRSFFRSGSQELAHDLSPQQIKEAVQGGEGTLWLDVSCNDEDGKQVYHLLRDLFGFHTLALDDAFHESHVPRVDDWEAYLYVVLHALHLGPDHRLRTQELDAFVGRNYLVTIHDEPVGPLDHLWDQCRQGPERYLGSGPDRLLYALADATVDQYMAVVDGLDEEIDGLENEIFYKPAPDTVGRIFHTRRTVLQLRRVLGYLREVMNRLARDEYAVIKKRERVYFRDTYDHLVRLYDIVDGLRDMAGGALDSYLSITSNRINEVMRTLTVVTVLFMPVSFLAGFFGMNFFGDSFNVKNPFPAPVLFWLCMALMVATPPVMWWLMARRGWLRSVTREAEAEARAPAERAEEKQRANDG